MQPAINYVPNYMSTDTGDKSCTFDIL